MAASDLRVPPAPRQASEVRPGSPAVPLLVVEDLSVRYGKVERLDDMEIARIQRSITSLVEINKRMWEITRKYQFPT